MQRINFSKELAVRIILRNALWQFVWIDRQVHKSAKTTVECLYA